MPTGFPSPRSSSTVSITSWLATSTTEREPLISSERDARDIAAYLYAIP
jgi:hypothetical protein